MNYIIQLIAMFLIGLGNAFISSAVGAFITDLLDEKFYDKGFSFLSEVICYTSVHEYKKT